MGEKMKALVLAGGLPQIDLIIKLKNRGIETILVDYYVNAVAKDFADKFYCVSTLDTMAVKQLAIDEKVDFIITVCTDQALLTMAKVSEELGLPCYIDYDTATKVTNKEYMKKIFVANHIPTAKYIISSKLEDINFVDWNFPVVVKPVDCNSSKGVYRAENIDELNISFENAVMLSRSNKVIVEEFIAGNELSVDAYVENGKSIILDITSSEKLKENNKFIIYRTWHPASITDELKKKICVLAQQIADSFKIINSPMLIQMLTDGKNLFVIEFSARTGGGVKYLSIEKRTGIDVVTAVIDLTIGLKPHIDIVNPVHKYMIDEYIYCIPGVYDHLEGFDELKSNNIISDYYIFRWKGSIFNSIENSGDRIAGFTIEGDTIEELKDKHYLVNKKVKVISNDNKDIMHHDFLELFNPHENIV